MRGGDSESELGASRPTHRAAACTRGGTWSTPPAISFAVPGALDGVPEARLEVPERGSEVFPAISGELSPSCTRK